MNLQLDKREDDHPSPYLLVIWKAGTTLTNIYE
jgi:hypothetical protein